MSAFAPPISVVVCTRNRAALLHDCLNALREQNYPAYEVVVVDNASPDEAAAQVTPFRCVREPRPGLNWARNRGAAEARYDLIAYIDDDARADSEWLRGIARAFADERVAVVTGWVLPAELETRAQQLFEQYSGMGKGSQARLFQRAAMSPRDLLAAHMVGVGANMAFRREALSAVGGFDTALDVGTPSGGGGDVDVFHRALMAGLTVRYEPTAVARHIHRREMNDLWRQLYNNGCSFGVYLIKVWMAGQIRRRAVARYAAGWLGGWVIARFARGLAGRARFPLNLLWAELWGALHAPWAYRATYRRDRQVRLRYSALTSGVPA
jgi:glycosyltransferase involved in cell wall biosynthesis